MLGFDCGYFGCCGVVGAFDFGTWCWVLGFGLVG